MVNGTGLLSLGIISGPDPLRLIRPRIIHHARSRMHHQRHVGFSIRQERGTHKNQAVGQRGSDLSPGVEVFGIAIIRRPRRVAILAAFGTMLRLGSGIAAAGRHVSADEAIHELSAAGIGTDV